MGIEVINTIIFCYHSNLNILIFNQILSQYFLKKEARYFEKLIAFAYIKAIKKSEVVKKNCQQKSERDVIDESQEIIVNSPSKTKDNEINNKTATTFSKVSTKAMQQALSD